MSVMEIRTHNCTVDAAVVVAEAVVVAAGVGVMEGVMEGAAAIIAVVVVAVLEVLEVGGTVEVGGEKGRGEGDMANIDDEAAERGGGRREK